MYLNIAFSLNQALYSPFLTAANSILKNTAVPDKIRFNVVIPPNATQFFQTKIATVFPNRTGQFHLKEYTPPAYVKAYLDAKFREKTPERKISRYMQYSRLFLKEVFPHLEKVAYLDCDLIVQGDIQSLFAEVPQFNDQHYIAAVPQCFPAFMYFSNPFKIWQELRKFKQPFNSGVLLTDVTYWTETTYQHLKHYLDLDQQQHYRLFNLGDETVMNLMFKQNYIPLDKSWNCCGYGNASLVTRFLNKNPSTMNVIHWSGGHHKPWRSKDIPFAGLWHSYQPQGSQVEEQSHDFKDKAPESRNISA